MPDDKARFGGAARGCRGMTLVELVLGMAITSLIGLAVAGMLLSISSASADHGQARSALVSNASMGARFGSAVRGARTILAKGDGYLVLWLARPGGSEQPRLSELQLIEWDSDSGELRSYQPPADLADADNTEYDLITTNFYSVLCSLKGTAKLASRVWAVGVAGWTCWLDHTDPRLARYVSYRATLAQGADSAETLGGAALRNQ